MKIYTELVNTRRQFKRFVHFPRNIYKNDPFWVPPLLHEEKQFLNPKTGPFFNHGEAQYILAYKNGRPAGRISAHVNHQYERYHDHQTGFFGFFECIDDPAVADVLIEQAAAWLKARGKSRMLGPMSFGLYDASGMLCDGFDTPPTLLTSYNPPYYDRLMTASGLKREVDWYAFRVHKDVPIKPSMYRIRKRIMNSKEFRIETVDLDELDRIKTDINTIFSEAWRENWGHVPLTDEQLNHFVQELKQVVVPELSYLAYNHSRCIGFSLSIKDINPALRAANGRLLPVGLIKLLWALRSIDRLRTFAMGVLKEYRNRGIDIAFYLNTIEKGRQMGYNESECSLIVESNHRMINALSHLSAEPYKTFRFYQKSITSLS